MMPPSGRFDPAWLLPVPPRVSPCFLAYLVKSNVRRLPLEAGEPRVPSPWVLLALVAKFMATHKAKPCRCYYLTTLMRHLAIVQSLASSGFQALVRVSAFAAAASFL